MEQSLETRIRLRAYEIWNVVGRPDGQADEHWLAAEREALAELMKQTPVPGKGVSRKLQKVAQPSRRKATSLKTA
jgi:hypothetical protein